jgi:uncharacterized protein YkwD
MNKHQELKILLTVLFVFFPCDSETQQASLPSSIQPTLESLYQAQQNGLNAHNLYRRMHNVGELVLSDTLNSIAQNYSNYMASTNIFRHSMNPSLGENLFLSCSYGNNEDIASKCDE